MEPVPGKYRLSIEHLPDPFAYYQVVMDGDGKPVDYIFLDLNKAYAEMTGLTREEIMGKRVTHILPLFEESAFDWIGTCGKVAQSGESTQFVFYFENSEHWYKVTAYRDEPGFLGTIFQDITEQKEKEEMLHKSEEFFRNLAENAQDFIFRCRLIPEISYEYISPSVVAVTGYTPEEHYSDPDLVLRIVHPDDLPILKKIKSGTVSFDRSFNVRYVRKSGEIVWTEEHMVPFYDKDGNLMAIEGNVRDITGRIEAEQTLKESEARNRALLDAIPDIMILFNREGEFIDYKANGGLIRSPEEFMFKKASQVLPPELARLTLERLGKVFQTGRIQQYEYEAEVASELRYYESRLVPCGEDKALAIIRDITERKEAEGRLQALVDNMPVMVDAFDENGAILFWNKECERVTGYTAEDIIGNPHALELLYPVQEYREHMLKDIESRGFDWRELELEMTCKDGTVKTIAFSNISSQVSIPGWHTWAVGVDITERKQAEEALRESEEKFRHLFEFSNDAHVLFDGEKYIDCNDACMKMLGLAKRDEFLTLHPKDISPQYQPDGRSSVEAAQTMIDLAMQKGTHSFEWVCRRKDGSLLYIDALLNRVQLQNKQIIHSVWRDITERKQAEKALRRREEEFRALAENAPDIVIRFDRDFRHVYVNPAIEKETGIPREQFIGKTHLEVGWTPETAKARTHVLREVFETAKERTYYLEYKTPKGWKHYHSRNVPEFAPDGTVETVLTITRDITNIKELEAALHQERIKTYRMHQRALPDELPEVHGLALAASYQPAARLQGDYYNVIRRHNQILLYLVDVEAGRDDGVMQSLYVRKTIEEYLQAHGGDVPVSPALLLRYLKERYQQDREAEKIPLCVLIAVFDDHPATGHPETLRYASSGFCTPPLMLKGTNTPGGLSLEDLYLAMDNGTDFTEHSLTIIPGSTFIFSTDGLFNQGPHSGSYKLRLQEVLRNHAHLPPELINRAVETDFDQFCRDFPLQNDLAFIVAQVPRQEQRLSFKVESDFKHIEEAQEKVTTLLAQHLGHIPDLMDFHELLVNAIEHGNKRDGGKTATVEMALTDHYYKVIITDQGEGFNWRKRINKELDWESESERGRGIIMTRMMADYLGYNERGNRVTMINLY